MNLMAATEAEEGEKNQIQEFCDCHLSNGNLLFLTVMVWNWWVINVHHGHSQSHLNCLLTSGAPDFGVCWNSLIKPVLNWANVCLPNILRTLWRTVMFLNWTFSSLNMVRTVWRTLLCSQLACNEMQVSAWTCSRQHDQKCRLKSSQYTSIIPHWVIQLAAISYWVPKTRLHLLQVNK